MSAADDDLDKLAGEYALGTLDFAERAVAASRRSREPKFDMAILAWERRLNALAETVPSVAPPAELLVKIMGKIGAGHVRAAMPQAANDSQPANTGNVIDITRRMQRWRAGALAASALAASLALGVGLREYMRPVIEPRVESTGKFVAVLQKDSASPAFLVSVDIEARSIIVRPVSAPAEPGKSYELWIVNAKLGAPKSLGVIGEDGFTARANLSPYDRDTVENSTYAVSLEDKGGSTTGLPAGAALFVGKLIQATP